MLKTFTNEIYKLKLEEVNVDFNSVVFQLFDNRRIAWRAFALCLSRFRNTIDVKNINDDNTYNPGNNIINAHLNPVLQSLGDEPQKNVCIGVTNAGKNPPIPIQKKYIDNDVVFIFCGTNSITKAMQIPTHISPITFDGINIK